MPRIVDSEGQHALALAADLGEERVVGVHDQRRPFGQVVDGASPALGDELELSVAVELVTKEVPERDDMWSRSPDRLGKRTLVHLEQAKVGLATRHEGRRKPGEEVRPCAVPGEPVLGTEDLRGHRRRGRLPVRGGDERHAGGEPCRERVDGARIELPEELPGQRRAATAPGRARDCADSPCRDRLERRGGLPSATRVAEWGRPVCSGLLADFTERSKLLAGWPARALASEPRAHRRE